jgi:chemotaxis signal transduction protein
MAVHVLRKHLLARVADVRVALPIHAVREVVIVPPVMPVPNAPPHVRGVVNLRGSILKALDLRLLLGMQSLDEEIRQMEALFEQRAGDHRNWLNELISCIHEQREFRLARNPHNCAFGKWYDSYRPANSSLAFLSFWRTLDAPHQRLHRVADHAIELSLHGDHEAALHAVDFARQGDLAGLLHLFGEVSLVLRQTSRELAIVLQESGEPMSVTTDTVDGIAEIREDEIEPIPDFLLPSGDRALIHEVARRTESGDVVMLLDTGRLSRRGCSGRAPEFFSRPVGRG